MRKGYSAGDWDLCAAAQRVPRAGLMQAHETHVNCSRIQMSRQACLQQACGKAFIARLIAGDKIDKGHVLQAVNCMKKHCLVDCCNFLCTINQASDDHLVKVKWVESC